MSRLQVIALLRQLNEAAFVLNVALYDATVSTECLFDANAKRASGQHMTLASGRPAAESQLGEAAAA